MGNYDLPQRLGEGVQKEYDMEIEYRMDSQWNHTEVDFNFSSEGDILPMPLPLQRTYGDIRKPKLGDLSPGSEIFENEGHV